MQEKPSTKFALTLGLLFLAGKICQPAAPAAEVSSETAPAKIVFNGLTSILGDNRVFLIVSFPDTAPENIALVEGQTFQSIKLLSVDFPSACIQIDNCGQIQTLKICDTPNLAVNAGANDFGTNTSSADFRSGSVTDTDAAMSPPVDAAVGSDSALSNLGLAAGKMDGANSENGSGNNAVGNASTDNGSAANAANSHVYYWWLQDAKDIEQTRLATAQSVLAGEMSPQPLTPLTPAGTAAALIGPDSVYMEHGPGVLISDQGTVIGVAKRTDN